MYVNISYTDGIGNLLATKYTPEKDMDPKWTYILVDFFMVKLLGASGLCFFRKTQSHPDDFHKFPVRDPYKS